MSLNEEIEATLEQHIRHYDRKILIQFENGRFANYHDLEAAIGRLHVEPEGALDTVFSSSDIHEVAKIASTIQKERLDTGAPHALKVVCQIYEGFEFDFRNRWEATPQQLLELGYGKS